MGLAIKVVVTNLRYTTGWQILSFQMDKTFIILLKLRFKNSRKDFYRNVNELKQLQVGDVVVVDAIKGYDIGVVSVCGELAKIQVARKRKGFKPLEARKLSDLLNKKI